MHLVSQVDRFDQPPVFLVHQVDPVLLLWIPLQAILEGFPLHLAGQQFDAVGHQGLLDHNQIVVGHPEAIHKKSKKFRVG